MGRIISLAKHIMLYCAAGFLQTTAIPLCGQIPPLTDTTILLKSGSVLRTSSGITIIHRDSLLRLPEGLKTITTSATDKTTRIFYDSLRYRASRTSLGRRLYDLVIVPPPEQTESPAGTKSLADFNRFNGLSVNSVQIVRLHPFGTDIRNPESLPQQGGDLLLNKTHIRTRESIIRKYLLFTPGDTVTGLSLSETERNLRNLPFVFDARIVVVPISESDADIIVVTRDSYSAGGDFSYYSPEKGELTLFERNMAGYAHGIEIGIPYDFETSDRPGIRLKYSVNNISRSFADLDLYLLSSPSQRYYGFTLKRDFISAESDYAGGISVREVYTSTGLDTISRNFPLQYAYQDYWIARSFMVHRNSLSRLIVGSRYIHNNVYERPEIDPLSYYSLQKYQLFLGSVSFSTQKFFKTNYIYNYGRTEDIPYGLLATVTAGREFNEFKRRNYLGFYLSAGNSPSRLGYMNLSTGTSFFTSDGKTEQGVIDLSANYFTGIITSGKWKLRGFVKINHTRGYNRYTDEYLTLRNDELVTGFSNDSLRGQQRTVVNTEIVAFSPIRIYGFRFTFFAFSDFARMSQSICETPLNGSVQALGGGVRIRNNNLIISTFQIRLAWYPGIPQFSDTRFLNFSGEPILKPNGFDAGPPSVLVYR